MNCQGLITKSSNKLKSPEFISMFESNDIVMLTETWSNEFTDLQIKHFENFALHRPRLSKSKRDSGGILIYVREHLVSKILFITNVVMIFYG